MTASSLASLLVAASLSGFGLPLGVPPQPEDPLMARMAPPECCVYFSWSGAASPQAGGANRLEQLLADKEMARSGGELMKIGDKIMEQSFARMSPEQRSVFGKIYAAAKKASLQPGMIYLLGKRSDGESPPGMEFGLVTKVGDQAPEVQKILDELVEKMPPSQLSSVQIGGRTFLRPIVPRGDPQATFGLVGQYFLLGIGENVVEGFVARGRQEPPAWLTEAQARSSLARRSSIAVINVRKILSIAQPPQEAMVGIKTLGLDRCVAIESVCGLDGDSFVTKTLLRTEGAGTGLFAPAAGPALVAADFAELPAGPLQCHVFRVDAPAIFELFSKLFTIRGPEEQPAPSPDLRMVEQAIGMKVREELLPSFGSKVRLWVGTTPTPITPPPVLISIDLKDSGKIAQLLARIQALAQMDGPRAPKFSTEKIGAADVTTMSPLAPGMPPISWVVTENRWIITSRTRLLREILQKSPDFKSLADAPEVAEALQANPNASAIMLENSGETYKLLYNAAAMAIPFVGQMHPELGGELNVEVLPDPELIQKYLKLDATTVSLTPNGLQVQSRSSAPLISTTSWTPVATAALLPAIVVARTAARKAQSTNNLKQIVLALHNYESANKKFPPAFSVDKNGKPLHSWRTLILPYLEQDAIYRQLKLDEPWDSEHNQRFLKGTQLSVYTTPGAPPGTKTRYQTIRKEGTVFPGAQASSIAQIPDGTSNTLAVVETSADRAVDWFKPDDFVPDATDPVAGLKGNWPNQFLAAFADGSVQALSDSIPAELFFRLAESADGKVIGFEERFGTPPTRPPQPAPRFDGGARPDGIRVPPPAKQAPRELAPPFENSTRP